MPKSAVRRRCVPFMSEGSISKLISASAGMEGCIKRIAALEVCRSEGWGCRHQNAGATGAGLVNFSPQRDFLDQRPHIGLDGVVAQRVLGMAAAEPAQAITKRHVNIGITGPALIDAPEALAQRQRLPAGLKVVGRRIAGVARQAVGIFGAGSSGGELVHALACNSGRMCSRSKAMWRRMPSKKPRNIQANASVLQVARAVTSPQRRSGRWQIPRRPDVHSAGGRVLCASLVVAPRQCEPGENMFSSKSCTRLTNGTMACAICRQSCSSHRRAGHRQWFELFAQARLLRQILAQGPSCHRAAMARIFVANAGFSLHHVAPK